MPRPCPALSCVAGLLVVLAAGCRPPVSTIRLGRAVALDSGEPTNPCERAGWVELVPTRASSSQSDQTAAGQGWVEVTTVSERLPGYGLWPIGAERPRDLRGALPQMNEPQLAADHLGRISGILRRQGRASTLKTTAIALLATGLGMMVIGSTSYDPDGSAVYDVGLYVGAAVVVSSLVPMLWYRAIQPSADERAFALPRTYVLVPGEDDLVAAQRGATTMNLATRRRCRGR